MIKTEHLLFILPMIPTLLIIAAGAVSMAEVALPALTPESTAMIAAESAYPPGGMERLAGDVVPV